MRRLTVMPRIKRTYGKGKNGAQIDFPQVDINLIEPKELAAAATKAHHKLLIGNWTAGKDATGRQFTPSARTIEIRRYDMSAPDPSRTHQKKKSSKRRKKKGPRYQERYPQGYTSKGGTTSFMDSGLLTKETTWRVEGDTGFVSLPAKRVFPVNAMEKPGAIKGFPGPANMFGVLKGALDDVIRDYLDKVAFPKGRR